MRNSTKRIDTYVIYFDEVKNRKGKQPFYWLGALAIPADIANEVEKKVSVLSEKFFGKSILSKETEFHGHPIIAGKELFEKKSSDKRVRIYKELLELIDSFDQILKIYICLDPSKFYSKKYTLEELAFMFLVEKTNQLMKEKSSLGILIGDYDESVIDKSVGQLSSYKHHGTPMLNQEIDFLIDTVHFTKSHHSRMIQLADIYVHSLQLSDKNQNRKVGKEIKKFIDDGGLKNRFPSKYKYWPK